MNDQQRERIDFQWARYEQGNSLQAQDTAIEESHFVKTRRHGETNVELD